MSTSPHDIGSSFQPADGCGSEKYSPANTVIPSPRAVGMEYRPEIDGLRAIAVTLVILYHANIRIAGGRFLEGGFIGVDIFFVISGYLIGSIILREISDGSFSFVRFYERRARRILPALYVVLLVSTASALVLLLPNAYEDYAKSLSAAALSSSNFYFWHSTSYDAQENLYQPLIHTWSLGIEEQFYIIVPIVLVLTVRYVRRLLPLVIIIGCLLSLMTGEFMARKFPDSAFYLLPSRFWELGVGVGLAEFELRRGRASAALGRRILPPVGLFLVFASVPLMHPQWHHPGLITAIPILGTALLIRYADGNCTVARILSFKPLVFVGVISYSLYLWHQPVFSFSRIATGGMGSALNIWLSVSVSLVLAIATFLLVEKPARNRQRIGSAQIWQFSAVGGVAILALGIFGAATGGFPQRLPQGLLPLEEAASVEEGPRFQQGKNCLNFVPELGPCVFAGAPTGFSLLTVGDSHARQLNAAMIELVSQSSTMSSFTPLNRGGCVFLLGMQRVNNNDAGCTADYNFKRLNVAANTAFPIAVLLSRLPLLIEGSRFDNGEGGVETGDGDRYLAKTGSTDPALPAEIESEIANTVHSLLRLGIKVVLVYPVPEIGWKVPQLLFSRTLWTRDPSARLEQEVVSVPYEGFLERNRRTYAMYDRIGEDPNLLRVYPEEAFCDQRRCFANRGANIYYRDDNHLSLEGARVLSRLIVRKIEAQWGQNSDATSRPEVPLTSLGG